MDFEEALKADIDGARRAMEEAKTRYRILQSTLAMYERSRRIGAHGRIAENHRRERAARAKNSKTVPAVSRTTKREGQTESRAARIRDIIAANQTSTGLTAGQIMAELERLGVEVRSNYLYSVLSKLRRSKLIRTRRGKYIATKPLSQRRKSQNKAATAEIIMP